MAIDLLETKTNNTKGLKNEKLDAILGLMEKKNLSKIWS